MFDQVELNVYPSCYNCLAWSADGEIALAAGEYVQILVCSVTTLTMYSLNKAHPK
jgi:hypothetical protein